MLKVMCSYGISRSSQSLKQNSIDILINLSFGLLVGIGSRKHKSERKVQPENPFDFDRMRINIMFSGLIFTCIPTSVFEISIILDQILVSDSSANLGTILPVTPASILHGMEC